MAYACCWTSSFVRIEGADEPAVFFQGPQLFLREGGADEEDRAMTRTAQALRLRLAPRHCGHACHWSAEDLVTLWIPLDPTTAESTLEYVKGSHRGPIFDSKYSQHRSMAIPDIEAQRLAGEVEVLGFPTQPGDVVAFHQATLHGGGSTVRGQQRRMMALRFIGANAFRSPRTGIVDVRAQAKTAGEGAGAEGEAPIVIGTEVGSGVPLVRPGNPSDPPDSDWTAGDYGVMGTDARMVQVLGSANPARASNEKPGLGPARL